MSDSARRVTHVVGARPNFMKAAPVLRALDAQASVRQRLVHTGQHYDASLSDTFFRQLELPEPDRNLEVGSGSHAWQTAEVMVRLEPDLLAHRPDLVIVYGDVNSTMAAALTAVKLGIPVAHVEAGLRSFDWTMPEEINRVVTDRLSVLLLTPSADADENLAREGIAARVRRIGNTMIDSLVRCLTLADGAAARRRVGLGAREPYVLVTLHRPSSVDDPATLQGLMGALGALAREISVVFPVHPRTRERLGAGKAGDGRLVLTPPLGYLDFVALEREAALVITDSGGVQEETTWLGVPCLTVRDNTERPVTVSLGTNRVVGRDPDAVLGAARGALGAPRRPGTVPELWDGHAGERAAAAIVEFLAR